MFSSTSSMLNSPFMGAYAAANTFLDALAAYRRREGLPGLSVSWGTWSETGMAVEGERAAGAPRSMLKGVGTLSNQDGLDALELLLRYNTVHAGVMPMDWGEWRRAYPAFSSMPFFRDLMDPPEFSLLPDHSNDQFGRQAARVAAAAGTVDNLVDYLTREIAMALKTTPDRVPVNVSLPSLGFDSLMAVEIKNRIETDLQVDMPVVKLLEGQSINYLSEFLSKKMASAPAAGAGIQLQNDGNKANANQIEQAWEEGAL